MAQSEARVAAAGEAGIVAGTLRAGVHEERAGRPEGVLAAIGHTPVVRLKRLFPQWEFELYAKLEGLNPGGSAKDRPALQTIRAALDEGRIGPKTVVVESTSGNFGVGLAQVCAYFGLRLVCVLDARATAQNVSILRAYGAEIDVVEQPDPASGDYLTARLQRVQELLAIYKDAFWPNQYANRWNAIAHHTTMHELVSALGRIDYLFCSTSTCGTLRGCSEYALMHHLDVTIVAVDAEGSVIFGDTPRKRLVPGHGSAIRPALYQPGLAHEVVWVGDLESIRGCRLLARREAILAGGSSGAIVSAIKRMGARIPGGAVCAAILVDRGERYLNTIYSDEWVAEHFGRVDPDSG